MGLCSHVADERILNFCGPHVLASVADIDVVELGQPRFFGKHGPIQISSVHPLEVEAERLLSFGTGPTTMDFQVQFFPRCKRPQGVESLHSGMPGPGLPKVGPEVGVVVRRVRPQFVHPVVPIEQVVWRYQDREHRQLVLQRIDEIAFILGLAGEHVVEVGERLHTQDCCGVGGQPIVWKLGGVGFGH